MNTHLYSFPCEKEWDDSGFHFDTFDLWHVTFYMKENQLDRGDVDDSSRGKRFIIHGPAGRLRSYLSWWSVQSLSKDLTLSYIKRTSNITLNIKGKNVYPKTQREKKCTNTPFLQSVPHHTADCIATFVSVIPLDIFKETSGHFLFLCLWRQNQIEPDCCCSYSPRCKFKECCIMTNKCPQTSAAMFVASKRVNFKSKGDLSSP